jgi:hypothetical protein
MARSTTAPKSSASSQARAPSGDSTGGQAAGGGNKPAHTIRYRNLKATIWLNSGQNGDFYSVTFTRSYQDKDEQWHDATSFNAGDLPTLAKLANDAHSWTEWHARRSKEGASS